mgnify:CR=1 FL=1
MRLKVVAIFDVCAEMYLPIQTERSLNAAIRNFENGCVTVPHKNDLELHYLGSFNDVTGVLESRNPGREILRRGSEVEMPVPQKTPLADAVGAALNGGDQPSA